MPRHRQSAAVEFEPAVDVRGAFLIRRRKSCTRKYPHHPHPPPRRCYANEPFGFHPSQTVILPNLCNFGLVPDPNFGSNSRGSQSIEKVEKCSIGEFRIDLYRTTGCYHGRTGT